MQGIYGFCPCGSGCKFKFCCNQKRPEELIVDAAKFPLHECLIANTGWQENGMSIVLVSRHILDSRYIFGTYMVDMYCLGLKNTTANANVEREKMLDAKQRLEARFGLSKFDYEDARSLILGAIDYASRLGFEPSQDWQYSRSIIEADRPYIPKFEYGKDGKPLYVSGPDDNTREILSKLAKVDHHYIVAV